MKPVLNTSALPTPPLSPEIELQGEQEDHDLNEVKDSPVLDLRDFLRSSWQRHGLSMPPDAEVFDTVLLPEGGVSACLTVRFPGGESHSIGRPGEKFPGGKQAQRVLYRRALSLWNSGSSQPVESPPLPTPGPSSTSHSPNSCSSDNARLASHTAIPQPGSSVDAVPAARRRLPRRFRVGISEQARAAAALACAAILSARLRTKTVAPVVPECSSDNNTVPGKQLIQVQTEIADPPVASECSSEDDTVLGKRSTRSEDEEDSESVVDAQPREIYGMNYRQMLRVHCFEAKYPQPEVRHQAQIGKPGLCPQSLYLTSILVGNKYFVLRSGHDSIDIATERLSKQALESFGFRPII